MPKAAPVTASRRCGIATVTDEKFLAGTVVLISSFLAHNQWFAGEIVIIHDGLSEAARARLVRFPNVKFHPVCDVLKDRLAELAAALPRLATKVPNLYALEAFNLPGYDWVLKLDGDMLCTGSVDALTRMDGGLLAVPDQSYFRGHVRHLQTYVPQHESLGSPDTVYPMTFNVGMLMIRPEQLDPCVYADLTGRVQPDTWSRIRTGHSDSIVLNEHFRSRWTPVPEAFNYAISRDAARYRRPRVTLREALFLHYIGRPKPWEAEAISRSQPFDAERRRAFERWDEASRVTDR